MYKFLLCWRYLRTRYIALASIISVMLGVATMIVVNSVMAGFTHEMQNRIQGILSDLIVESRSLEGMPDAEAHAAKILEVAGDQIEGVTPAVVVPAMLNFQYNGTWVTRQVQLIGIDERTQSQVSDFGKYLQHEENRRQMSFALRDGYDTRDHNAEGDSPERVQMRDAGWKHRREWAQLQAMFQRERTQAAPKSPATGQLGIDPSNPATVPGANAENAAGPPDPFAASRPPLPQPENMFDPAREQHTGIVLGIAMASYRIPGGRGKTNAGEDGGASAVGKGASAAFEEGFVVVPGDDVKLTFPTAGQPPKAVSDNFTVVDFYESKMAEYDSSFVFVPLRKLQELRGMIDPTTGIGMINSIQIKLKPGADGDAVRDRLRQAKDASGQLIFPPQLYLVSTWRDKQGALLAAVQMETAVLNILLFLIIAVAGFGILAIFYMIVVEKTRDIGILKSLGASGRGVMGIFLAYGLSLGMVGSGVGMVAGLLFVRYINQIADFLGWILRRPLFNPEIYYFYKIPTIVFPATVAWIVIGALAIAVLASVLPARRAACLHPVQALRYE